MTQLCLFDWSPSPRITLFPCRYRTDVLREIADAFVRDGMTAGNRLMMQHGCDMIDALLKLGMPHEEVGAELDKFMAAAREAACEQIHTTGMIGGKPYPPRTNLHS